MAKLCQSGAYKYLLIPLAFAVITLVQPTSYVSAAYPFCDSATSGECGPIDAPDCPEGERCVTHGFGIYSCETDATCGAPPPPPPVCDTSTAPQCGSAGGCATNDERCLCTGGSCGCVPDPTCSGGPVDLCAPAQDGLCGDETSGCDIDSDQCQCDFGFCICRDAAGVCPASPPVPPGSCTPLENGTCGPPGCSDGDICDCLNAFDCTGCVTDPVSCPIGPGPGPGPGPEPAPKITKDFGTFEALLEKIHSLLFPVAILIGFFLTARCGYVLMTSQGNPEKVRDGKECFTSAIIGLVFVLISVGILRVIIGSLIGNPGF
jgi:hypothetical protein